MGGGREKTHFVKNTLYRIHRATHVGHIRCERGAVQRRLGLKRLEYGERLGIVYTSRLVFAACDEIRFVGGHLKVGYDVHVGSFVRENLFARVGVEERDFSGFVACEDHARHVGKCADCRFAADWVEHRYGILTLCCHISQIGGIEGKGGGLVRTICTVVVAVDVEDSDGTLVAHALLSDTDDLLIVVRKRDALDGGRELPHEETLAGLH